MPQLKSPSHKLNEAGIGRHKPASRLRASVEETAEPRHEAVPDTAELDSRGRPVLRVEIDGASRARVLSQLQQDLGNAYVQRLVTSMQGASADLVTQRTALAVQRTPDGLTRGGQETEAQQTITRLTNARNQMLAHANQTFRNTGRLLSSQGGQPARLLFDAMTLRSDNASILSRRGENPSERAYYFYGASQNNEHRHRPVTMGTIDGNKILVRGRSPSGTWRTTTQIMNTFTHEGSHILVASYGEHPGTTTDAASFDRYKDEFRAYWIEPTGHWGSMPANDAKAAAIRAHLVGTSATDTHGYPALRTHYWSNNTFKTQVDNHKRPDGFNLSNNPNLDRLFQLLNGVRGGTATRQDVLVHLIRMSPEERTEAAESALIQRTYRSMGYLALVQAITQHDDEGLKRAYQRLTPQERGEAASSAALLLYIDRQVDLLSQRASIYAMILGGAVGQFDAMGDFLVACFGAQIDAALGGGLTEVPADVRSALRRLVYRARLALFRLVEEARREYVDALPNPVRGRLLTALREGGEP